MMTTKAIALSLAVMLGVVAGVSGLTPQQQAAWKVAEQYADYQFAGAFETMCTDTMSPNPYFNLIFNPTYVPWGGYWQGPTTAGVTGCPALFSGFAETWTKYADWAIITHMQLHGVNQDATAVYGTLTLDSNSTATGNTVINTTVGHILYIGTSNGKTVVDGLALVSDSAAFAASMCTSNTMVCSSFGGSKKNSSPTLTAPPALTDITPPALGSIKGLAAPGLTSAELHSLAVLMTSKQAREYKTTEATNLSQLQAYWSAIFAGNFPGAEAYLSPTVTLSWQGQFDWVPVAGTYVGKSGWATFFGNAAANTRNFTFTEFEYQGCNGNACAMTWNEHSIVKASERAIDGFINFVIYYFNNDNLIQHIEVLVDSMSYAAAFCDGFVVCGSD